MQINIIEWTDEKGNKCFIKEGKVSLDEVHNPNYKGLFILGVLGTARQHHVLMEKLGWSSENTGGAWYIKDGCMGSPFEQEPPFRNTTMLEAAKALCSRVNLTVVNGCSYLDLRGSTLE